MKNSILLFIFSLLLSAISVQAQDWIQVGQDIDGEAAGDYSGSSVSVSSDGSTLAIGAPNNHDSGIDAGQVRVYQNNSGTWTQIGQDIDGEAQGDNSGISVSLNSDGSIVAIGAYFNDENGTDSGHVRIYQNISGTWMQMGQDIDGEASDDWSGMAVSLSSDGSVVAIGAGKNDGNGTDSGHVRVYQYISGIWTKIGADIDGEAAGDESGTSVSLNADGSIVAIGAPNNGSYAGHVRVYQNNSGTWTQIGQDIDGEAAYDMSGTSVSISADGYTLAIGAPRNSGNGSNSGQVRVFQYNAGVWTQIGQDIDGEAVDDMSGNSVSINDNGSIVAIGASRNDGNGSNSGHVRIYKNNSGTWTRIGTDINGEMVGDYSGYSVSLSADGETVAIGAPYNDGNGGVSGHVREYYLLYPPTITNQPVNQTDLCLGSNTSFTVTGTDIATYQWQVNEGTGFVNISNNSIYSGATTATLTITGVTGALDNNQYRCFVTNAVGYALSNSAMLTTDHEPPVIPALPNITGECSATATAPTTTDNCVGTVSGTTTDPLTYTTQGTHVITWTFDDGNGNTATATQNVIIDDVTNPTITCPGNQTINLNQGETFYTVSGTEFNPTATDDNCNVASVVNDFNNTSTLAGEHIPIGTTTIEWTVTDDAGNEMTCSFNVLVNEYVNISELKQAGISIYPNPSNGIFTIENADDYEITITDITGKIVYQSTATSIERVRLQQSGVYMVNFRSNMKNFSSKIIVE